MTTERNPAPLGVVPSLDLDSVESLFNVIEQTCKVPGITEYKLGGGPLRIALDEVVKRIRDITDIPILYDHQKAGMDMPDNAKPYVEKCHEAGVDGLLLFPVAGPEAVRQFVGRTIDAGMIPVAGGDILLPDYAISDGGFVADDAWERIVEIAGGIGGRHFVMPAKRDKVESRTRWLCEIVDQPVIYIVGFGPLGGRIDEAFAAAKGAPALRAIVGRSICAQPDPGEAAKRLVDEVMQFA